MNINSAESTSMTLVLPIVVLFLATIADATCNSEQLFRCQQAAESGQLETTRGGGGDCIAKQYLQYTHVCLVVNYMPSIDFCCCSMRQSETLCCRYRQAWNHFRCVESDDIIETPTKKSSVSWEQLSALSISGLVACACVATCALCCCYRRRRRRQRRREPYQRHDLYDDDDADVCACACYPSTSGLYAWCDGLISKHDDEVIKIASMNGGDTMARGTTDQDDDLSPRTCSDRLPLSDWTDRATASAPVLPSDVIVCLGACRNGAYQTVTATTMSSVHPPSYAESVYHCARLPPSSLTFCHRHCYKSTGNELMTSQAAQLNYYTNRT